ncbi:MAG TPA: DUF1269 domain-containing protein [Burkholderiales bacterium]|nr:DUF1269 domain-containing protein [Burkholderiales bacterium]
MRRRLYFVLPDVESARQTSNDLLLARVDFRHMHFLAKRGTDLGDLHECSALQKTDVVHGAETGLVIGGVGGFLLGLLVVFTPPPGVVLDVAIVLATVLGGALIGAWIASLVGAAVPNSRLKQFESDIEAGRILMMVDVRPARVEEIRELVHRRHPEASGGAMEPTVPAFP